jgi:hypothetical protein
MYKHSCLRCSSPTNNPKFCSRSCSTTVANRTKPKRRAVAGTWCEVTCHYCGAAFQKLKRNALRGVVFCSASCASKAYWSTQQPANKHALICPCGKSFQTRDPRQRCCSTVCGRRYAKRMRDQAYPAYIAAWLGGEPVLEMHVNGQINRHIRRYLFEKYGSRCTKCDWAQVHPITGRVPLTVEHLDGDWKNNSEDNLTLLCPNCHSLTLTFGSLNRGRGRPRRPSYACLKMNLGR